MTGLVRTIPGAYHDPGTDEDFVLNCQWWFSDADPAAIVLRCPQPHDREVRDWTFGRSLIARGLHAAAGLAAVHIEPCQAGDHLNVTADFDDGPVTVAFPILAVQAFLVATTAMCPLGEVAESGSYTEEMAAGVKECLEDWPR